jgi:hypothetical protein
MIRYQLDDLGWYQFEWLVQALLKNELGIGVESWGGHGDHGRDAWCAAPLHFPDKRKSTKGPFLFQVKFVENANAAGAKSVPRLMAAVKAEAAKIASRKSQAKADTRCRHYAVLTNCVVSPEHRSEMYTAIREVLSNVTVHCLGGNDVCDLLDANPALRRSFPQLLSLRDLDALLESVVNRDIIERSLSAISHAKDLAAVFVPTDAYINTWEVLKSHHFVVLEGPPEMGKSAIGWMIALAQIASGWEANVCDNPDDFFRALRADVSQIFIADDAFGRTEYDPSRGANWEAQLHRVLPRLGDTHWLVWTSRRHILERARKQMDLQGAAHRFPQPAEVLVDASQLRIRDKALMLYRHAKHVLARADLRAFIQAHAKEIVHHSAFTPERIRLFVSDAVPQLVSEGSTNVDAEVLSARVKQEIQNPTERMRKCFEGLPLSHKWMLLALLESGHYTSTEKLLSTYREQCGEDGTKPSDVLDELTEAFVRVEPHLGGVEWIHPSYRDLIIEQLHGGGTLKSAFLKGMNLAGIKLALSDSGGPSGKLRFPLISSAKDWDTLQHRTLEVARSSNVMDQTALLTVLIAALDSSVGPERSTLLKILTATCQLVRQQWDSTQAKLDASAIRAYAAASERASPMEPMPSLEKSFQEALQNLIAEAADHDSDFLFEYSALDEFLAVVEEIRKSEPRLLRRINFPEGLKEVFEAVLARVDEELESDRSYESPDIYDSEADASFGLAASLKDVAKLLPSIRKGAKSRIRDLTSNANRCRERYNEIESEAADGEDYSAMREEHHLASGDAFDIQAVFVDL